ncbi:unnamed protein product [Symbiodinium sp. CCMP2592]|nr:unnamed protein product [Symbiodinium sp. CCMP2592]
MGKKAKAVGLVEAWRKHGERWTSRYPWLIAMKDESGKVQSLGCSVCCEAPEIQATKNAFASCGIVHTAQTSLFDKHEKSKGHRSRSESMLQGPVPVVAPPVRQFADVLEAVFRGDTEVASCGPWKFRCIVWALAEAHRNRLRSSIERSVCMSIQQDVRNGQLLVKFTSVDPALESTEGVLGQVDLEDKFGLDSKSLVQGTLYVLHKLAARGLGQPSRAEASTQAVSLDRSLVEHMKEVVEVFAADAAPDEQRAGKILRTFFPKLQLVQYDKAQLREC